jgi:hypothetical protein
MWYIVIKNTQIAKAVRVDQDALFEIFERMKAFFQRLDIYTKVAPNRGMADTVTASMEVLNFGIVRNQASCKAEQVSVTFRNKFPLTRPFSEKYLKKLTGTNDHIEEALKRLDRLTQEEAWIAAAELLKVTNAINSEVREVADNVLVVNDRVVGVDERVAGVEERVAGVDDRVKSVDDRVKAVDDKLAVVSNGAQHIFNQLSKSV